jgi:hypothetical protein
MAGKTILRGAGIGIIRVTINTGDLGMFPFQLEGSQIVVELGWRPAFRGMAGSTIRSKAAVVRIITGVASKTIDRRSAQIGDVARIEMAGCACCTDVSAGQREGENIMGKVVPIAVNTIMAGKAIFPEREQVGGGKDDIKLLMTGLAYGRIKIRILCLVAICTGKRRTIGKPGMTFQRITQG